MMCGSKPGAPVCPFSIVYFSGVQPHGQHRGRRVSHHAALPSLGKKHPPPSNYTGAGVIGRLFVWGKYYYFFIRYNMYVGVSNTVVYNEVLRDWYFCVCHVTLCSAGDDYTKHLLILL